MAEQCMSDKHCYHNHKAKEDVISIETREGDMVTNSGTR